MNNTVETTDYTPDWAIAHDKETHNRILSWSSPIITLAIRLTNRTTVPDNFSALHNKLCGALKSIESKMHIAGYRPQYAFACRYLLCAIIDNSIYMSSWGKTTNWDNNNLVDTLQGQQWSTKEFFHILQNSANKPQENIDFLELAYYCLKIGLPSKETVSQKASMQIITTNLGNCLKHHKRNPKANILKNTTQRRSQYKRYWLRITPKNAIIFFSTVIIAITGINIYTTHSALTQLQHTVNKKIAINYKQDSNV